jgi:kynureninase
MHDDLTRWRDEFPILSHTTYMISNSLGAMPRGAREKLKAYADTWASRGVRAWDEEWWEMPLAVGNRLGRILGAPESSITMQPNVSLAQSIILSCFGFDGARNKIVTTEMNFPSVLYVLHEQARRGARVEAVPTEDGVTIDQERLLEAIDEETLVVSVSHVLFRSAFIQDARAVVEKAHRVGARVILDVYQSAGCVPVDLTGWNVDFAVGGCLKSLSPSVTGWQAHARPFDFEAAPMEWGDPAYRLLTGTPAIPGLYAAVEGLRIIEEIGVPRIRERSLHLTGVILEAAGAAGIPVTCPTGASRRGGTVALRVPEGLRVTEELIRGEILVDYRPKAGIRVSPHFYSTDDECRRVVSETAGIRKQLGLG